MTLAELTVAQSNALFLLVAGVLIGLTAFMAYRRVTGRTKTPWVWILAPIWIPFLLWAIPMSLYMWDRGLLPWQT